MQTVLQQKKFSFNSRDNYNMIIYIGNHMSLNYECTNLSNVV